MPILERECTGDASDAALLKYVEFALGDVTGWRSRNKDICQIPYNSSTKCEVSIRESEDQKDPIYLLLYYI